MFPFVRELVRARQGLIRFVLRALNGAGAVGQELLQLRHCRATGIAQRDLFLFRIDNEQRRPDADRILLQERRVCGILSVDRQPDEPSGVSLERFVREHERAHRATRVSPRSPGIDEHRNVFPLRLRQGLRVVVVDKRQDLFRQCRRRREKQDEQELSHGVSNSTVNS